MYRTGNYYFPHAHFFPHNISSAGKIHVFPIFQENCSVPASHQFLTEIFTPEQRRRGAVLFHIVICLYMFGALAIVCHEYFVPSLECIGKGLKLRADIAGATIMALGGAIPPLATSVIGVFVAQSDIALGSIVGSAFFNSLFVPAMCGFFAGQVLVLEWLPVVRDCGAYLVVSVILTIVVMDGQIHWYEAVILISSYFVYLLVLLMENRTTPLARRMAATCQRVCCGAQGLQENEKTVLVYSEKNQKVEEMVADWSEMKDAKPPTEATDSKPDEKETTEPANEAPTPEDNKEIQSTEYHSYFANVPKDSKPKMALWLALLPISALLYVVVPDCRRPGRWQKLYLVTFAVSILVIGLCAYILVWMLTVIGSTMSLPDVFIGLTVLALGANLPDLLNSVFVARKGYAGMAISNCIASNTIDISLCLGIPWLMDSIFHPGKVYTITHEQTYIVIGLITSAIIVPIGFCLGRWRITPTLAAVFLGIYVIYIVLDSAYDLRVAVPPCEE